LKPFRKKRGDDVEEKLISVNTDRAGCKELKGQWNPKSGQCDIRQIDDKNIPDEIVNKSFDKVIRPEETGGVKQIEDPD
jgi:hypothetical protein